MTFRPIMLALAGIASLAAQSPDSNSLRDVIAARYVALRTAIDAKDQAGMRGVLAPDFVNVDINGERTDIDEFVGWAVGGDPPSPGNRRTSTVLSVTGGGTTLTATERYESNSPYPTSYGPHYRRFVAVSTDRWRLTGGSWRLLRSDTQEVWTWCDAVLVEHVAPPARPGGEPRNLGGTGKDCIDQEPKAE